MVSECNPLGSGDVRLHDKASEDPTADFYEAGTMIRRSSEIRIIGRKAPLEGVATLPHQLNRKVLYTMSYYIVKCYSNGEFCNEFALIDLDRYSIEFFIKTIKVVDKLSSINPDFFQAVFHASNLSYFYLDLDNWVHTDWGIALDHDITMVPMTDLYALNLFKNDAIPTKQSLMHIHKQYVLWSSILDKVGDDIIVLKTRIVDKSILESLLPNL